MLPDQEKFDSLYVVEGPHTLWYGVWYDVIPQDTMLYGASRT